MKSTRISFVIFAFAFLGTTAFAQFTTFKYKDLQDVKDRQLIVILATPNPSIIHKYDKKNKPEVVQNYEQVIGTYNDNLKFLAAKFWNFTSKEILYKSWGEYKEMTDDKNQRNKYIIMYSYSLNDSKGFDWYIDKGGERLVGSHTAFMIGFPDENVLMHNHYLYNDLIPTAVEMAYQIATTNYTLKYILEHGEKSNTIEMADENAHILASKTLLILKDEVNSKVLDHLNQVYPCNIKLVDQDEMQKAVTSGDASSAYLIYNNHELWIINCEDGATLGYSKKDTDEYGYGKGSLRDDFFKDIADFCGAGLKK